MTMNISSEFNSTLNQLQGLFNQLGGSTIKGGTYINSVFGIASSVEQIASGDSNQQAAGIQSLINQAMSLVEKLVNAQTKANKKVKEDAENAEEVIDDANETEAKLNDALVETGNQISAQTDIVNKATGDINTTQQKLDEKQNQIKDIIAQIQEKQQALESARTTEEQKALLGEIEELGLSISSLTCDIESYQDTISEAAENIESAVIEIETAKGNSVKIQEDGAMEITAATQEAAQTTGDVAATQADGVKNITLGTALESSAAAESIVPIIGGVLSSSTAQKGAELISAGTTETTGSVTNLQTLLQGIGGIANNTQLLATFKNSIGSALGTFNSAIGTWNNAITPVITSIGSFTSENGYIVQVENLQTSIISDYITIEEAEASAGLETEVGTTLTTESGSNNAESNNSATIQQNQSIAIEAVQNLETPRFKFGI